MRKTLFGIFILITIVSVSCKKDINPGTTDASVPANGWWVTFKLGGSDVYKLGTFFLTTYNTSENDDSLWVDDLQNSWGFKCKVKIDFNALTFAVDNSTNVYYDPAHNLTAQTATITEGKVLLKAGRSKTGLATDSIYFKATFPDDPGDVYEISGTARTGIAEDDY